MEIKDITIFRKLMQLTLSDNDSEALLALRKANALLLKYNNNWEDFINGRVKGSAAAQQYTGGSSGIAPHIIDEAFDFLLRTLDKRNTFRSFIESLHTQWEEKAWLSDKQMSALMKAFEMRSKTDWADVS